MDDAQTWTVIGAFVTFMLGTLTMVWYSFTRVLRAEIGGLRGEMGGLRGELSSQISELRGDLTGRISELRGDMTGQIGELRGEVRALTHRVDAIDQDLQKLVERHFRDG